jgi:deazaflavin-dependent oxidoreductase (nitroreductase family)
MVAIASVGAAVFERLAPRRAVRAYQRSANRLYRPLVGLAPGWTVIETTGWRTGMARQVPVGARRDGRSVWLVAGDGHHSGFVRNIHADPHVRILRRGRWHDGTAHLVPGDDARRRAVWVNPINGAFVLVANPGANLLSVRVDLASATETPTS